MVSFPNCKINLGLYITGKRSDGFHNLETIFYPVDLTDALEIITNNEPANANPEKINGVLFSVSGIDFGGNPEDNICVKAYHLIRNNYLHLLRIKMHLHKSIPVGAGLGGGSADGAFTLKLLNAKFNLGLSASQLIDYALQLGSDCPFFIVNKPVIATGRGEIMKEIKLDLSAYKLVIVNPAIHINTGWAFSQLQSFSKSGSIETIVQQPVEEWKNLLHNDFEAPVMNHYPSLQAIKENLYKQGAVYASMSGSGSTFYGIFAKSAVTDITAFPTGYLVKEIAFLS